jgi:hypothetical protein
MGKGVILDAFDQTAAGREYNLAGYLLVSSGRDGVGEIHASPEDWWAGWDLDLGAATAARTGWNGLLRRDFAGGMVLLNEPGSPARTVALPRPMRTVTGDEVSTVTLGASRAAVLRELPAAPAGEEEVAVTVPPSSAVTVPPIESQPVAPAPVVAPEPVASPAPAGKPAPSRPARKPRPRGTAAAAASRRVAAPRLTRGRRGLRVSGRVRGASRGHVRVVLHRRGAGRWARVRTRTLVVRAGRFSHRFEDLRSGRYRVRAVYLSR